MSTDTQEAIPAFVPMRSSTEWLRLLDAHVRNNPAEDVETAIESFVRREVKSDVQMPTVMLVIGAYLLGYNRGSNEALSMETQKRIKPIDLLPFCSNPSGVVVYRENLNQPWSAGLWSYATDGAVIVRVRRRYDIEERKNTPNAEHLFQRDFDTASNFAAIKLPEDELGYTILGGRIFGDSYLRKVAALPGVKFAKYPHGEFKAIAFTFDGGSGLLKPCRGALTVNYTTATWLGEEAA